MKIDEFKHILSAIILLTIVSGFTFLINLEIENFAKIFFFSIIIILTSVFAKKMAAFNLDSDVEHETWKMSQYWLRSQDRFKKPVPTGIILPLAVTIISLGTIQLMTFLTYETRALKYRASKRFGYYSYREMTEFHNGVIGAAGIIALLVLAVISYFIPASTIETLSKLAIYYAFWNLIPFSKLDGSQIFFGSRILWSILAAIITILAFLSIAVL